MGIVKLTNTVYGIGASDMIVPGGPVKQKYTEGDLTSINFKKLEKIEREL